jgi:thymidylate synthase
MAFINTVYFDLGDRACSPPPRSSHHRRRYSHSRRRHAQIDKHHIDDIRAYVKNLRQQQKQRQLRPVVKWDPIGEAIKTTFFGYELRT